MIDDLLPTVTMAMKFQQEFWRKHLNQYSRRVLSQKQGKFGPKPGMMGHSYNPSGWGG